MASYQTRTDSQIVSPAPRLSHIIIEDVMPSVDGGRYPAKRIAGEPCVVEADIFRDGHQVLRAAIKWRRKQDEASTRRRWRHARQRSMARRVHPHRQRALRLHDRGVDRPVCLVARGLHQESEGRAAGGIRCSRRNRTRRENDSRAARGADRELLERATRAIAENERWTNSARVFSEAEISAAAERVGERFGATRFEPLPRAGRRSREGSLWNLVRDVRALAGTEPGKPGTFHDAERRLPELRDLGFDVVYLTPIHPIGHTNRKGPGNCTER